LLEQKLESVKQQALQHSPEATQETAEAKKIIIDNLPLKYNRLSVQEMIKDFPGAGEIAMGQGSAQVEFNSGTEAKLAMSGKTNS